MIKRSVKEFRIAGDGAKSEAGMRDNTLPTLFREIYDTCPDLYADVISDIINKCGMRNMGEGLVTVAAERDVRDEPDKDFATVLLSAKLEYKQEERIAKRLKRIDGILFRTHEYVLRLHWQHFNRACQLAEKISEMSHGKGVGV